MREPDPPRPRPSWRAVRLDVPGSIADEVAGWLGRDSLGVEIVADGPRARVTVFVADDDHARRVERRIADDGTALWGLAPSSCAPRTLAVADEGWVERYRASLRALPLGDRFAVVPRDGLSAPPGRSPIRIEPGRAFGTGEHPTTRLCAAVLERRVAPGSRWADVGTGSGILALVAAACGAGRVDAVDVDPEAVDIAREGVRLNGFARTVRVSDRPLRALGAGVYDGVVANVSAEFVITEAGPLTDRVRAGGIVVVSGFLVPDAGEVENALDARGARPAGRREAGEWACAIAERIGGSR